MGISLPPRPCNAVPAPSCSRNARCVADCQATGAATSAGICVADTQEALQALALAQRRRFPGTVVAITGSNGKTTVKEMTAAVLQQRLRPTRKAPGNLNNHIGVPLALLQLEATHQVAVLELGMNHLGEIRRLCELALPHIGVITNIGLAHVGYVGSIEHIQQAKGELIEALDASSVAIVNADDPRALALGRQAPGRLLTFGQGSEADIHGWVRVGPWPGRCAVYHCAQRHGV